MGNNLQQQAYESIRQQIIYSELAPGSKISDRILEEQLTIGRTPIREALIQLRNQELIKTIPQSGTYISKIDIRSADLARYMREKLEQPILQECSAKMNDTAQQRLEMILEQTDQAILAQDKKTFFLLDKAFHQMCYKVAGKEEIWPWLESYSTHLDRFRWLRLTISELDWGRVLDEHQILLRAMKEHALDEVGFLCNLHLHMIIEEQEQVILHYPNYFEASSEG
ncbi:Transcriptional regulator, GntR family [Enterococcus mundtii 1A]|uniref:GntR family transcriptional regulator n=1 Tax=Enterococcus mundtii TaxID=53346 RepID=UPI000F7CFEF6|nr:GntR family transcriptional regulator [Enterococcus mundtii]AZP91882.1 GntR family transcriptional regulator [Enterococcus mundtii]MDA9427867.1 Transcriptional regulator, GntR family [Enterococcus mundtii 1A]MDO7879419.1 GntR family transcriptional regulator [Enterococcus mundtii]